MGRQLQDKVIVVLGVSDPRSMAAITAMVLANAGAKVVVAGRQVERVEGLAKELNTLGVCCDVSVPEQIAALAERTVSHFGRIDGAINFAGINVAEAVAQSSAETLRSASDVHFVGATLFVKEMANRMSDGGSVVTVSSQVTKLAPPGMAAYAGSKAAADQMVKIAAVEYGPAGVRVNSIAPGFTETAMTAGFVEVPTLVQAFLKEIPLRRLPTCADIADAAMWLLSPSCFVTGQVIDLSGGQTLCRIPTSEEMMGG